MADSSNARPGGYFHRIVASSNSGARSDRVENRSSGLPVIGLFESLVPPWLPATEMTSDWRQTNAPSSPAPDEGVRPQDVDVTNPSLGWGEEGPLSGGRPGLHASAVYFGEPAFPRSDPKAVGSASESSCDTHVEGIGHTEVVHASGPTAPSSTDCIESGVSKRPESHQVLLNGSKVERYVDAKDRRQPAALSRDRDPSGPGRSGLGNDRAGLPPPSSLENPLVEAPSVTLPEAVRALAPQVSGGAQASSPPKQRAAERQSAPGETVAAPHRHPGVASALSRSPSGDRDPSVGDRVAVDAGPNQTPSGAGPDSLVKPIRPNASAQTPPSSYAPERVHAAPPALAAAVPNAPRPEPPPTIPLVGPVLKAEPLRPLPRDDRPRWGRADARQAPEPASEPQVRIGCIDVIIESPPAPPQAAPPSSHGTFGMASRYYLKGL